MIKLILADLDGTLTEDKGVYKISIEALEALRRAENMGIKIALVSGNSYPVLRGLHNYLGITGGVVAENGCIVYYGKKVKLCKKIDICILNEFREKFKLKDSWQNEYRECDFGFIPANLTEEMIRWAKDKNVYINTSGYAVHIALNPAGKSVGVRKLLELHGLKKEEVAAIGDSLTDIDMFKEAGLRAAVGNADEKLKKEADVILNLKSGNGVKEFINYIMDGKIWN